jgi:hypothetical protein
LTGITFGMAAFGAAWIILGGETFCSIFSVADFWTGFGAITLTGLGFGASNFETAFLWG